MNRTIVARPSRVLLVACGVSAVLLVVVEGGGAAASGSGQVVVLLPFLAMALAAIALRALLPRVDDLVERMTRHREVTPYSALAETAARVRGGSLEEALPGLAQVLARGTGAVRAVLWLAVGDRLVSAAQYPEPERGRDAGERDSADNLAVLLTRPDTDHVVPVLDGAVLRAVLAIGKPGAAVTPADQQLMRDVANGAGLLLRGVALNAELAERVRRADELATQLQTSRQRLARAREVERRRLVLELAHVTTDRLAALRTEVTAARTGLEARPEEAAHARAALARARVGLDELLDRFRAIARGVYPAVLRDQGPAAALDEVAADLPRPVRLTADLAGRLAWEIESGLYYVAAAALHELAGRPADRELRVHLQLTDGRVSVLLEDPTPTVTAEHLRAVLVDDAERLAALGGHLDLAESGPGEPHPGSPDAPITVRAWLPDRLEPLVEVTAEAGPR